MMLPITRATVNNFCRVCLQNVQKLKNTVNLQHVSKKDPQFLRIIELLADGVHPIKPLMTLAMPTCLCYSCYTRVGMFCKFAEMSICSRVAFTELTAERFDLKYDDKFKMACSTCFKIKSNHSQTLNTNSPEMQNLLRIIFMGINQIKTNEGTEQARNICQQCAPKLRILVEFQKVLQKSHKFIVSTVMSNENDMLEFDSSDETNANHSIPINGAGENENKLRITKDGNEDMFPNEFTKFEIDNTVLSTAKAENKCAYCQRQFKRKTHLKDHVRLVHQGLRPYKCEFCERAFGLPRTLRIHLMGHTKERPFKCKFCQKAFRQKTELNLHLNSHFASSEFRCPICSHDRASQEDLDAHLARHNNRDGYQCSTCGRKFKKLCHLKEHDDAVHLKLRPFKCTHNNCGKAFGARKTLQTHQRIHTRERPYNCGICGKQLACKASFLRHSGTHNETAVKQEVIE